MHRVHAHGKVATRATHGVSHGRTHGKIQIILLAGTATCTFGAVLFMLQGFVVRRKGLGVADLANPPLLATATATPCWWGSSRSLHAGRRTRTHRVVAVYTAQSQAIGSSIASHASRRVGHHGLMVRVVLRRGVAHAALHAAHAATGTAIVHACNELLSLEFELLLTGFELTLLLLKLLLTNSDASNTLSRSGRRSGTAHGRRASKGSVQGIAWGLLGLLPLTRWVSRFVGRKSHGHGVSPTIEIHDSGIEGGSGRVKRLAASKEIIHVHIESHARSSSEKVVHVEISRGHASTTVHTLPTTRRVGASHVGGGWGSWRRTCALVVVDSSNRNTASVCVVSRVVEVDCLLSLLLFGLWRSVGGSRTSSGGLWMRLAHCCWCCWLGLCSRSSFDDEMRCNPMLMGATGLQVSREDPKKKGVLCEANQSGVHGCVCFDTLWRSAPESAIADLLDKKTPCTIQRTICTGPVESVSCSACLRESN